LDLRGKHAVLSPSKYHWINYTSDRFIESYSRRLAQQKGNALHDLAQRCIILGVRLPNIRTALNQYVNDAIGFNMVPEQILVYSPNAFGCADAISFRGTQLRIHDLKTGITKASMEQLLIYAALFCLEYDYLPNKIDVELRIYQGREIIVHSPEEEELQLVIEKMILFDKTIHELESI